MGKKHAIKNKSRGTAPITEKKKKRLENKMRKTEAFLALALSNGKNDEKQKESDTSSSESEGDDRNSTSTKNAPIPDLSDVRTSMTAEEIRAAVEQRKREIIARQKRAMTRPKLFTTLENLTCNSVTITDPDAPIHHRPLYIMDIQQLLLYAIQKQYASYKPLWCKMLRVGQLLKTCLIILDQTSARDYKDYPDSFTTMRAMVPEVAVDFVPPEKYKSSLLSELLRVPLSPQQIGSQLHKIGDTKSSVSSSFKHSTRTDNEFGDMKKSYLLLSTEQMIHEDFPIPSLAFTSGNYGDFVYTKDHYEEVTDTSPMFALDCEMCMTKASPSELARVSIVNQDLECVYDTYVKPRSEITNYLTKYSGITKRILDPIQTRIEDVQRDIRELLPPDAILVGQSLGNDLKALKMFHPYIIDTSVIYNLSGQSARKTSLKNLSQLFLGKKIQDNVKKGHSSVEDSTATMELVLLKLKNGLAFGDVIVSNRPLNEHLKMAKTSAKSKVEIKTESDNAQTDSNGTKSEKKRKMDNDEQELGSKKTKNENCESDNLMSDSVDVSREDMNVESEDCQTADGQKSVKSQKDSKLADEDRRRAVFMNNRARCCADLFDLVALTGKTMSVVDSRSLLEKNASDWLEVNLVKSTKSHRTTEHACREVKVKDFTWVRYQSEGDDEKETNLKYLDEQVAKVKSCLPERSLLMVLLTGSGTDDGMVFAHIT